MNKIPLIKNDIKISDVMNNFIEIVEEIPFGNSRFQNEKIVVGEMKTPERAYRHSAIRIQNRFSALNECELNLKRNEIKIERHKREISRLEKSKKDDFDLDIKELEIDIEEIEGWLPYIRKLIKDAIIEINTLLPIINNIWKLTWDEFEKWEVAHFSEIHSFALSWLTDSHSILNTIKEWNKDLYSKITTWEHILAMN